MHYNGLGMHSLIANKKKNNNMTQEKEIGYEITNVAYHNLEGFAELWKRTEADTKDLVVEENGRVAIELAIPIVSKRWTYRSLLVGIGIGLVLGLVIGILLT